MLFHRLRWRLLLGLGLGALALLGMVGGAAYALARERVLQRSALELVERQQRVAEALAGMFAGVEQRARELALQLDDARLDRDQLLALLRARVLHDSTIAQVGVMTEADNPLQPGGRFGVTVTFGAEGLAEVDFLATGYRYWEQPWYRRTLDSPEGWWSDPYFNDGAGGQDTVTYDLPLRDADGRSYGMIGLSVSLDRIAEIAAAEGMQRDAPGTQYALADARGQLLLAWDPALERAYGIGAAAQRTPSPLLAALASLPVDAGLDLQRLPAAALLLASTRVAPVGWGAALAWSHDDLLEPLHHAALRAGLLALLPLFALLLLAGWLARRIGLPMEQLVEEARRLGDGEVPPARSPAVRSALLQPLAEALQAAAERQRSQGEQLTAALAAQRQTAGERALAQRLQASLLPPNRVFFGTRLQAELVGALRPAAMPMGDSYGFFAPAPGICLFHYLGFHGAGVDAVLAMNRLAAVLPAAMRQGGSAPQILGHTQELLQHDDAVLPAARVLLGRLDLDRGELQLAAAGAGWSLLLRRADGRQQVLALAPATPLQRDGEHAFSTLTLAVDAGDRLLLPGSAPAPQGSDTVESLQVALERHAERAGRHLAAAVLDVLAANEEADCGLLVLSLRERD